MSAGAEHLRLSSRFQEALGVLVSSENMTRQALVGQFPVADVVPGLSEPEVACLDQLLREQGARVLVLAEILTARRKSRIATLVPITMRILGPQITQHWKHYVESRVVRGKIPGAADAASFCAWVLERVPLSFEESQLVRYELCRSDVANRASARVEDDIAEIPLTPCRCIRFSGAARLERFDSGIAHAVTHFARSGDLTCQLTGTQECLVFHKPPRRRAGVAVMSIPSALELLLQSAGSAIRLSEVLDALLPARRPNVERALQGLLSLRILEIVA